MSTGEIKAICMSEKKGTSKRPVEEALFITEHGLKGDAHAGDWHRQVSFLALEEIEDFRRRGGEVEFGDFGENIVAEGIAFDQLPVGTRLKAGEVFFEVTQIGKKCHSHCEIFRQVGDCIMPRKGVFGRVLHGGRLKAGDTLTITEEKLPLEAAVITASDKGAKGEREDKSGDKAEAMLKEAGGRVFLKRVERAIRKHGKKDEAKRKRLDDAAQYFRDHRRHMNYPLATKLGFPIGSGAMESQCSQFQGRFKRTGQYWSRKGFRALIVAFIWNSVGMLDQLVAA